VKLGAHVRDELRHKAGRREDRVADLHSMYIDPEVRLIMSALGGYNSNELLPFLDYDLVRQNPKGLVGYSDITALHLAIHEKTGLVSFYGPHLMSQFGEFPEILPYTLESFVKVVGRAETRGRVGASEAWTEERLEFDKEDDRPRRLQSSSGWKMLKPGQAVGPLVGGEITTLVIQTGTEYMPSLDGAVLFWEDYGSSLAWVDRFLSHLRTMEVYDRIAGMLVGRTRTAGFEPGASGYGLENVILESVEGYDIPVMANLDFGHTDPIMTLPIGVRATMRPEDGYLSLDEPAVS